MQSTKINIGEVRFSYLHVFEPKAGSKKYSVALIIPKSNTVLIEAIKGAIKIACESGTAVFGEKLPVKDQWTKLLRDGDLERASDEVYKNSVFINCYSVTKPGIVKPNPTGATKFIAITDEEEFASGDYGYASVNFYAYDNSGNKGVACGLNNILKTRTGERLSGKASADSDFGGLDIETTQVSDDDDLF